MKAVLLCPGPSLARLDAVPPCDLSISVNRAAIRFACDWWAASDYPTLRDWQDQVLGTPALLTKRQTFLDFHARLRTFREVRIIEDLTFPVPHWDGWTATAALGLAASIGAKHIDVYGADWTNEPDFDGQQVVGCVRDDSRWAREREVWNRMVAVLAERGGSVTRH